MARSKSSANWLKEHFDDKFVQQSKQDGYRSRASYKLLELNDKAQLIKEGMTVVDLGSAPVKINGINVIVATIALGKICLNIIAR